MRTPSREDHDAALRACPVISEKWPDLAADVVPPSVSANYL
jgi:hypothetical protein